MYYLKKYLLNISNELNPKSMLELFFDYNFETKENFAEDINNIYCKW